MKTLSGPLTAHLLQEVTTLATCWKVTLRDATILGFTDHVADLIISGVTYDAATGYTPSAVQTSASLEVDNLELLGGLDETAINATDLIAGKWDFARVEIFQVNYLDLTMGTLPLRSGTLGQVTRNKSMFQAELRGVSQALTQGIGRLHMPGCDADLGDARCGINLATFPDGTVSGSVSTVVSRIAFLDASLLQPADWFAGGLLTFTSGFNNGFAREVKSFGGGGVITLQAAMPFAVAIADTYSMTAGCDKSLATCQAKFSNTINFRGFPHLPGVDRLLSGR